MIVGEGFFCRLYLMALSVILEFRFSYLSPLKRRLGAEFDL